MTLLRWLRPSPRRLLAGAAMLTVLWLLASFAFVYLLTRRPHARFAEPAPQVAWGKLEEHRLTTSDGEDLGAWYHRSAESGPAVVVLHGFRGCRRNSLAAGEFFAERGCSVLMLSLRAHGDSSGDFTDVGYSAKRDVIAAVEFLEHRQAGRPILVNGTSMGSAAAIFAAGDLGERVAGYLLESPYSTLHQAVRNRTEVFLPPLLDRVAYLGAALMAPLILSDADRIAPIEHIAAVPRSLPVVILCGECDRRARPAEAKAICDRIADQARLVIFDDAGHECLVSKNRRRYAEAAEPLLATIMSQRR
jgi:alpha-beta hydrolase superfamily lysophospholipase